MESCWLGFGLGLFTGPMVLAIAVGITALALGLVDRKK